MLSSHFFSGCYSRNRRLFNTSWAPEVLAFEQTMQELLWDPILREKNEAMQVVGTSPQVFILWHVHRPPPLPEQDGISKRNIQDTDWPSLQIQGSATREGNLTGSSMTISICCRVGFFWKQSHFCSIISSGDDSAILSLESQVRKKQTSSPVTCTKKASQMRSSDQRLQLSFFSSSMIFATPPIDLFHYSRLMRPV